MLPNKKPPYAAGSDTAKEAADSVVESARDMRSRVYLAVATAGAVGITCDEAEAALGFSHQTCSARFNELRNAGLILDCGMRRLTRSGRKAAVYMVPRGET